MNPVVAAFICLGVFVFCAALEIYVDRKRGRRSDYGRFEVGRN